MVKGVPLGDVKEQADFSCSDEHIRLTLSSILVTIVLFPTVHVGPEMSLP